MKSRALRALLHKELAQLRRSRGALASAVVLPLIFLSVIPLLQIGSLAALDPGDLRVLFRAWRPPPGLGDLALSKGHFLRGILPLFVAMGGLMAPAVTAVYALVAEREARTLELLAALPVRMGQVLGAKLFVVFGIAGGVSLALYAVDAVVLFARGLADVGYLAALGALLVSALGYSTAVALLIGLLAKDLRSANNLNGALFGPAVLALVTVLGAVPGECTRLLAAAGMYTLLATLCTVLALRVVTFERLLR